MRIRLLPAAERDLEAGADFTNPSAMVWGFTFMTP